MVEEGTDRSDPRVVKLMQEHGSSGDTDWTYEQGVFKLVADTVSGVAAPIWAETEDTGRDQQPLLCEKELTRAECPLDAIAYE